MSANVSRALRGSSTALAGPPQDHPQPRDHLFEAERLGHVVVAAERQTGDLVLQGVASGQEQRGSVDAVGTQPSQHAEAVHAGHHHVEDDGVGTYLTGLVERGGTVGGGVDLEALELQAHREQLDDVGLVVDDQTPRLRVASLAEVPHSSGQCPPCGGEKSWTVPARASCEFRRLACEETGGEVHRLRAWTSARPWRRSSLRQRRSGWRLPTRSLAVAGAGVGLARQAFGRRGWSPPSSSVAGLLGIGPSVEKANRLASLLDDNAPLGRALAPRWRRMDPADGSGRDRSTG